MDEKLRLYFESMIRLANGANPVQMTDQELIGCVGLLPSPAVDYSAWLQKTGFEVIENQPRDLTDEERAAINDKAVAMHKAMEKRKHGSES